MSIDRVKLLGRVVGLFVVTLFAAAVMWATGIRSVDYSSETAQGSAAESAIVPAAPVAVQSLSAEHVEVLNTYAGMIQPFERYRVGFEVPGRVQTLSKNDEGQMLDEGDVVARAQVLATLDRRILTARVTETTALLEQAQQEFERAQRMRRAAKPAISETNFQARVTNLAVAEAQVITAQKNLEDATLKSPCDGVISRRLVNPGESIAKHDPAFEIVEVDRVLLVVGVPESRVQQLERRQRQLIDERSDGQPLSPFRVHVRLMGRDRFGTARPERAGVVHRIGQTADDKTALFEVEILLDNRDRRLRPGLVARARFVVDEMMAYRIPIEAVLFRGSTPYFYAVQAHPAELNALFWNLGSQPDFIVKQVPLAQYIEQEGELIVQDIDELDRMIVVRGQHRLVGGRRVRVVSRQSNTARQPQTTTSHSSR